MSIVFAVDPSKVYKSVPSVVPLSNLITSDSSVGCCVGASIFIVLASTLLTVTAPLPVNVTLSVELSVPFNCSVTSSLTTVTLIS
jgi:hypothetical protein